MLQTLQGQYFSRRQRNPRADSYFSDRLKVENQSADIRTFLIWASYRKNAIKICLITVLSLIIFKIGTWLFTEDDVIEPIADYPSKTIDITFCRPRDLKGHITIRKAIIFHSHQLSRSVSYLTVQLDRPL